MRYTDIHFIRKICPCNVYPLEPHFYIAKLGYAGVSIFLILAPKYRKNSTEKFKLLQL